MTEPASKIQGRFALLAEAGTGGMGTVYRAQDGETGETVAVKLLRPQAQGTADRFVREAELLSSLRHPAIVRHVAHGMTERGEPYLAMEWLEGEDLSSRLLRGPLSIEETAALAKRLAGALAAAHAVGVVHRDVKPSNVFLPRGEVAEARLLDFGIARLGAMPLTRTGVLLGTPGYMAPEQARGERSIDGRADVFSLGCVLYECITGHPAFTGENLMALFARILLQDPERPASLREGIPPQFEALILRMLSKDPERRPGSANTVLSSLSALDAMTSVASPSLPAPAGLGVREQRWISIVFARAEEELKSFEADTLLPGQLDTRDRIQETVKPLGARVERLVDGSMIAFFDEAGAAHDRAIRMARCALSIASELGDRARVALATGRTAETKVPVGEVIERGVALARRSRSPSGSVRIDEVTAGLLDARFEVSGDDQSLVLRRERTDERPRQLLGKVTPCVGRERELSALAGFYDECTAEQVSRVVLVTAPPGTGKSRCRRELLKRLADRDPPPKVWLARADAVGAGSPYGVLVQLVRAALGVQEGEAIEVARRKVTARVAHKVPPDDAQRVAVFLAELIRVPFPEDMDPKLRLARSDPVVLGDQIRMAWEDFVRAELEDGPIVLILEDLHWGDLPSIQACDVVLRRIRDRALLVLATARPEVHELFPKMWSDRDLQEVRLAPLATRASERLVRTALGDEAPAELVREIVERADGNAFFLEEMIRASSAGERGRLPETILAMMETRLSGFDEDSRRVLRAASVFGEAFWPRGVAALLGGMQPDAALSALVEREVVEPRAVSRFMGEREYTFRHALVRDAAQAMLTPEDSALGHRLAAQWLESVGETDAIVLAEHYARGGDNEQAARWFAEAAEHALEGNDFAAVVRHAERAVALGGGPSGTGYCHALVADAQQWLGNDKECLHAACAAMKELVPGSREWFGACMAAIIALTRLTDVETLEGLCLEASRHQALPGAEAARAMVLIRGALRLHFYGTRRASLGLVDEAFAAVPTSGEEDLELQAWLALGEATRAHSMGEIQDYLSHVERCADLLERAGDLREAIAQRDDIGWWWPWAGDPARAIASSERVKLQADRLGIRRISISATHALGLALIAAGDGQRAVRVEEDLLKSLSPSSRDASTARVIIAEGALAAGDLDRAERDAHEALAVFDQPNEYAMMAMAVLCGVAMGRGDIATAATRGERLLQIMDGTRLTVGGLRGRIMAATALARAGNTERATRALRDTWNEMRKSVFRENPRGKEWMSHHPWGAPVVKLAEELGITLE